MAINKLGLGTPDFILNQHPEATTDVNAINLRKVADASALLRDRVVPTINQLISAGLTSSTPYDTGRRWVNGDTIMAKYVSLGSLPNSTSANTAHGLTTPTIISCQAMADNGTLQVPIPNGVDISLAIDNTNVVVTASADYSAYTGWALLEYV